jgi:uncharacterized membrane protein YeaQ/YmgE (transglycosylase-associated protein family)
MVAVFRLCNRQTDKTGEIMMGLTTLIGTAIVGLIVGGIAKWLAPGPNPGGCLITILIGIAGSFIARFLGGALFGWYDDGNAPGWIMSILGAMLLLWLYRMLLNRRG